MGKNGPETESQTSAVAAHANRRRGLWSAFYGIGQAPLTSASASSEEAVATAASNAWFSDAAVWVAWYADVSVRNASGTGCSASSADDDDYDDGRTDLALVKEEVWIQLHLEPINLRVQVPNERCALARLRPFLAFRSLVSARKEIHISQKYKSGNKVGAAYSE